MKNPNSSLLEINSKKGMQQISMVKMRIRSLRRSEMGRKERKTQLTEVDHRDLLHCVQLEPSLTGRKTRFIETRRNETVNLPKEQRGPVSEETIKAEDS